jgi:aromatic-L-amino-acid/L-tryptophan decarboxylase
MTPEEFRRVGHELIDWIAAYRVNAPARPVSRDCVPGSVRARLPATPPVRAEPMAAVLKDLDEIIVPALTDWQHPRFFGYFPGNSLLSGVLGDLASTGLGVLGLTWQSSPALTELEEVTTDWVRQIVGLPAAFRGVIQDTASTSTLIALICARERAGDYAFGRGGLQGQPRALRVYTSEHCHSSVDKAALLADFGRDNVCRVPCDGRYAMRADALDALIEADLAKDRKPAAVVATVGTTTTTAMDPVAAIAAVARRHGIWLHVDAAMAGGAMIVPECRTYWAGVEQADSLVLNAHKWLGVPFDCSLYFVRDPEHLVRVMSTNPSYLQSSVDGRVTQYRDWGIPLGRRFRALKLWFVLREQGVDGLAARVRRDLANAQALAATIRATENWRVLAPVPLQTLCIRHEPTGLDAAALDSHTLHWVRRLNSSGAVFLTPAQLDGRWMARVSIGALDTEAADIAEAWQAIRAAAESS